MVGYRSAWQNVDSYRMAHWASKMPREQRNRVTMAGGACNPAPLWYKLKQEEKTLEVAPA